MNQHLLRPGIGLTLVLWLAIGCGFSAAPSLVEIASTRPILTFTPAPPIFTQQPILPESIPTPPLPVPSPPGHPTALPLPPITDANARLAGAQVEISAQPAAATVGDLITLIGRPANLGLPQYTLYLRGEPAVIIRHDGQLIFQGFTGSVVEFVSASAGQSEVEFTLRAAQPGVVEASIAVLGEVRLTTGLNRPAWAWDNAASSSLTLLVVPAVSSASTPQPPVTPMLTSTLQVPPILPENVSQMRQLAQAGRGAVETIIWSPDGRMMAVAGAVGVYLHDAETLQELRLLETDRPIKSLSFSPTGDKLAFGDIDGQVQDYVGGFSPDARFLAIGGDNSNLEL